MSVAGGLGNALWSGQVFGGDVLVQWMAVDRAWDPESDVYPGARAN